MADPPVDGRLAPQVARHRRRAPGDDLAHLARRQRGAVAVDDAHLHPGGDAAHRSRRPAAGDDVVVALEGDRPGELGLAVVAHHRHAVAILEGDAGRLRQRRGPHRHRPHRAQGALARRRHEVVDHRRGQPQRAHPVPPEHVEGEVARPLRAQQDRDAEVEPGERPEQPAHVGDVQEHGSGGTHRDPRRPAVFGQAAAPGQAAEARPQRGGRDARRLRAAGRPRREHDDGLLGRRRLDTADHAHVGLAVAGDDEGGGADLLEPPLHLGLGHEVADGDDRGARLPHAVHGGQRRHVVPDAHAHPRPAGDRAGDGGGPRLQRRERRLAAVGQQHGDGIGMVAGEPEEQLSEGLAFHERRVYSFPRGRHLRARRRDGRPRGRHRGGGVQGGTP